MNLWNIILIISFLIGIFSFIYDLYKRNKLSKEGIDPNFIINPKEIILKIDNAYFSFGIGPSNKGRGKASLILTKTHLIVAHFDSIIHINIGDPSYQPIALRDIYHVELIKKIFSNPYILIKYLKKSKESGFRLHLIKKGILLKYSKENTSLLLKELQKRCSLENIPNNF